MFKVSTASRIGHALTIGFDQGREHKKLNENRDKRKNSGFKFVSSCFWDLQSIMKEVHMD